jgi:hypothetical protein
MKNIKPRRTRSFTEEKVEILSKLRVLRGKILTSWISPDYFIDRHYIYEYDAN